MVELLTVSECTLANEVCHLPLNNLQYTRMYGTENQMNTYLNLLANNNKRPSFNGREGLS